MVKVHSNQYDQQINLSQAQNRQELTLDVEFRKHTKVSKRNRQWNRTSRKQYLNTLNNFLTAIYLPFVLVIWILENMLNESIRNKQQHSEISTALIILVSVELFVVVLSAIKFCYDYRPSINHEDDKSILRIIGSVYFLLYLLFLIIQLVKLVDISSSIYGYLVVLVYLRTVSIISKLSSLYFYRFSYQNSNVFGNQSIGIERLENVLDKLIRNRRYQNQKQYLKQIQKVSYLDKFNIHNNQKSNRTSLKSAYQQSIIDANRVRLESIESSQEISQMKLPRRIIEYFQEWSDELDFNPFKVQKMSDRNGLYYYLYYVFEHNGLMSSLNINKQKFMNMMTEMQKNYLDNPYHNSTHAMDVTQTMNFFLKKCEFQRLASMNDIQLASCYLACAAHDINHPGFNNMFYVNSQNQLSILYNDKAVLENYHCSFYFNMLQKTDNCILSDMSAEHQKEFRSLVVSMILATDMSIHFSDLETLKKKQQDSQQLDLQDTKQKQDCMNYLVHAADISNPIKNIEMYGKWAEVVIQEFFQQGDKEKEMGLTVSYLCDRETTKLPQSQIGFIDFVVFPLFDQIRLFLPELGNYMNNFQINKKYYELMIIKQKCK